MSAIFSQANCKQLKGKFTAWSGDVNDKDEKKLVKDLSRLLGDVALKNEPAVRESIKAAIDECRSRSMQPTDPDVFKDLGKAIIDDHVRPPIGKLPLTGEAIEWTSMLCAILNWMQVGTDNATKPYLIQLEKSASGLFVPLLSKLSQEEPDLRELLEHYLELLSVIAAKGVEITPTLATLGRILPQAKRTTTALKLLSIYLSRRYHIEKAKAKAAREKDTTTKFDDYTAFLPPQLPEGSDGNVLEKIGDVKLRKPTDLQNKISELMLALCGNVIKGIQCVVTQNIYYDGRKISGSGTQSVYICDEFVTWYGIDRDNVPKDSSLWKTTPMIANRGRIEQASRWTVQEEAAAGKSLIRFDMKLQPRGISASDPAACNTLRVIGADLLGKWSERMNYQMKRMRTPITTTLDRPKQSHPEVDADMSAPEDDDQVQASEIDSFPAAGQNNVEQPLADRAAEVAALSENNNQGGFGDDNGDDDQPFAANEIDVSGNNNVDSESQHKGRKAASKAKPSAADDQPASTTSLATGRITRSSAKEVGGLDTQAANSRAIQPKQSGSRVAKQAAAESNAETDAAPVSKSMAGSRKAPSAVAEESTAEDQEEERPRTLPQVQPPRPPPSYKYGGKGKNKASPHKNVESQEEDDAVAADESPALNTASSAVTARRPKSKPAMQKKQQAKPQEPVESPPPRPAPRKSQTASVPATSSTPAPAPHSATPKTPRRQQATGRREHAEPSVHQEEQDDHPEPEPVDQSRMESPPPAANKNPALAGEASASKRPAPRLVQFANATAQRRAQLLPASNEDGNQVETTDREPSPAADEIGNGVTQLDDTAPGSSPTPAGNSSLRSTRRQTESAPARLDHLQARTQAPTAPSKEVIPPRVASASTSTSSQLSASRPTDNAPISSTTASRKPTAKQPTPTTTPAAVPAVTPTTNKPLRHPVVANLQSAASAVASSFSRARKSDPPVEHEPQLNTTPVSRRSTATNETTLVEESGRMVKSVLHKAKTTTVQAYLEVRTEQSETRRRVRQEQTPEPENDDRDEPRSREASPLTETEREQLDLFNYVDHLAEAKKRAESKRKSGKNPSPAKSRNENDAELDEDEQQSRKRRKIEVEKSGGLLPAMRNESATTKGLREGYEKLAQHIYEREERQRDSAIRNIKHSQKQILYDASSIIAKGASKHMDVLEAWSIVSAKRSISQTNVRAPQQESIMNLPTTIERMQQAIYHVRGKGTTLPRKLFD